MTHHGAQVHCVVDVQDCGAKHRWNEHLIVMINRTQVHNIDKATMHTITGAEGAVVQIKQTLRVNPLVITTLLADKMTWF